MPTQHMPDADTLDALRRAPDAPVVMLNLVRYRRPDGRERFQDYGAITGPLIAKAGGRIFFGGRAGPTLSGSLSGSKTEWDDVLLVRFPNPARFLAMIEGDTYRNEAAPIRAEALEATLWMTVHPFPGFEGED